MMVLTFALLAVMQEGARFRSELLWFYGSTPVCLCAVEVAAVKAGLYFFGSLTTGKAGCWLDMFVYCGYKFTPIALC